MNQVVITIARQYGSGGRTVGKMLAERLGISFYDKQIIQMASDESGIDVKLFGKVEEGDKVKGSLFGNKESIYKGNLHQPGSKEFISDENLFNYQAKVVNDLAEKESYVIVGRCVNYVFKDRPNTLRVFIHAPWEFRVEQASQKISGSSAEIVEIEELDQGINKMAHRISGLLENVRQEKEMQHLTELQLIQAQVNPHFLYNTLDTIVWLIEGGMTDDAVEMISSLSIFFRTSLSKGNDIIPLSEEKRHTLSYLEIQQFRYRDILEFELSIPKELDGVQVPKLSIQPLAENALYHGIKNRRGKGKITITGREEEDAIVLTVNDNGQGMSQERLHEVQEAIRTGERAGFGLAAVAERIALYYGPGYGMTISSKEGEGTTVELRLGKNIQPKS